MKKRSLPQNSWLIAMVIVMMFNVTFNNISGISWRSILLVEETEEPGEKPLTCRKSLTNCITYCCIEYGIQTHNVSNSWLKRYHRFKSFHHTLSTVIRQLLIVYHIEIIIVLFIILDDKLMLFVWEEIIKHYFNTTSNIVRSQCVMVMLDSSLSLTLFCRQNGFRASNLMKNG